MSNSKLKRLVFGAGIVALGVSLYTSPASATESKPCKEHPTTTTTAKPKSTTTTVKPTTTPTAEKPKPQQVTTTTKVAPEPAPTTSTAVEVAAPEIIETNGEVNADDSIQPVQLANSTAPTELAQTGAMTTWLALLAAALTGIGWVILLLRNRLAG